MTIHTIQEAAALTCYGPYQIRQMAASGEIPGAEMKGRTWLLPDSWVRDHIPPPGWLSPQEYADAEGITRAMVHKRIRSGKLFCIRRGPKKIFVPPPESHMKNREMAAEWVRAEFGKRMSGREVSEDIFVREEILREIPEEIRGEVAEEVGVLEG